VVRNDRLRIGRYTQHFVDTLPLEQTPVSYLQELGSLHDAPPFQAVQRCRAQLGRYGLEAHAHTIPVSKLSGGQKARVVFAGIPISMPHILLFDEPTNHLDIESIEALAEAIAQFKGGVVLVSHDARLIRSSIQSSEQGELWVVGNGTVTPFEGDMDDYTEMVLSQMAQDAVSDGKIRLQAVEGASVASAHKPKKCAEQDSEEDMAKKEGAASELETEDQASISSGGD